MTDTKCVTHHVGCDCFIAQVKELVRAADLVINMRNAPPGMVFTKGMVDSVFAQLERILIEMRSVLRSEPPSKNAVKRKAQQK